MPEMTRDEYARALRSVELRAEHELATMTRQRDRLARELDQWMIEIMNLDARDECGNDVTIFEVLARVEALQLRVAGLVQP